MRTLPEAVPNEMNTTIAEANTTTEMMAGILMHLRHNKTSKILVTKTTEHGINNNNHHHQIHPISKRRIEVLLHHHLRLKAPLVPQPRRIRLHRFTISFKAKKTKEKLLLLLLRRKVGQGDEGGDNLPTTKSRMKFHSRRLLRTTQAVHALVAVRATKEKEKKTMLLRLHRHDMTPLLYSWIAPW